MTDEATFDRMMWDSMIVKPEPTGEQPRRSKKKGRVFERDSLATRNKIGLPGSRRHRYWMNEFFLLELNKAVTGGDQVEFITDQEWYFPLQPPTPLKQLFDDAQCMSSWAPFIDITEAEQDRLLGEFSGESNCSIQQHLWKLRTHQYKKSKKSQ